MGSSSPMLSKTVILASSNKSLIRVIRSSIRSLRDCFLEVCRKPKLASCHDQRRCVAIVLLDVTRTINIEELQGWLQELEATDVMFATVSNGNDFDKDVVSRLLQAGATDHLELPLDQNKF